eukprot:g6151.t1
MKRALTKQACDVCSRKKRQCSGEKPCQRCKRAGTQCTYSVKAIGRTRPAETPGKQGHPPAKKVAPAAPAASAGLPPLSVSHATGLQGLQESKFLSVFLEHCAPMYPVADDASIRDGLMHEFVGLANKNSQEALRGPEAMRGQALSCSLFSCIAIGGLMAGSPPTAVAPHMSTAQASLSKFGGLSDAYAVRAYVLYAMASEFLGGLGPGTEYRKGMEAARAVFEKLPAKEKEPILSAVLSHFMVLEGLPLLQHVETSALAGGGGGGIGGGGTGLGGGAGNRSVAAARERNSGTSYVCCKTAHEESTFQKALATRADVSLVMAPHPPPAYVVADATLLTIRFSRDRGDVATRLWHLHDFATSELRRFRQEGKGAVAILALMNPLMGVKIRLGRLDGMLEAAELASSLLQTCPGLVRISHAHVAHVSMAVYRLYGRREAYDALRQLFARTIGANTPSFDEIGPSAHFCDLPVCAMHLEKLLKMEPPHPGGGSNGSVGSTTGSWGSSAGGLLEGGGAFAGVRVGAGVGTDGATSGGVNLSEQGGTQPGMGVGMGMGMAGRQQSRRHTGMEGEVSGFSNSNPALFRAPSRDQLLASDSYSATAAGVSSATPFVRPELPPPVPDWGNPDTRVGSQQPQSQALPPQSAPRNPLAVAIKTSTSTPFDGLPQPQSQSQHFGAGPPAGLGMALGAVFGSATAVAGGLFDPSSLASARREQAASTLAYAGQGTEQRASHVGDGVGVGVGVGGVGPAGEGEGEGADMASGVAAAAWAGGNVQNPQRNHRGGGDGGWEGSARRGADMMQLQYRGHGRGHGLEYGVDVGVPAASPLPVVSTSAVGVDAGAHQHDQHPNRCAGVNYGTLGVVDDTGPGRPTPAPDL